MNVTVFCGSNEGKNPKFKAMALELAQWIVDQDHTLVYGGGVSGLMGIIAERVLALGGDVIGIMPHFLLEHEGVPEGLEDFRLVDDMAVRKNQLIELSDIIFALPGGPGTLEELTEAYSWALIGQNDAPIIALNVDGFYDPLFVVYEQMTANGFFNPTDLNYLYLTDSLQEAEAFIENYQAPPFRQY